MLNYKAKTREKQLIKKQEIMELSGKIKKLFDVQTFASGFKKRELVITTQEQYPQDILVEFTQDRVELVEQASAGDEVRISINLRGREWVNPEGVAKYFNSIHGWRIEKLDALVPLPIQIKKVSPGSPEKAFEIEEGDLPF